MSILVEIVRILAEDIYFYKCLFYNVPSLSDSEKEACIQEAIDSLPAVLETLAKYYEYLNQEN